MSYSQLYSGFTLFEVILVIFLSATIALFGVFNLFRLQNIFKVRSSADEIRSQIQYGREQAIANKNSASYSVNLLGRVFSLKANGGEMVRHNLPSGVEVDPSSLSWVFTPLTGKIIECSPCQITFSVGGVTEVISILENGLVN